MLGSRSGKCNTFLSSKDASQRILVERHSQSAPTQRGGTPAVAKCQIFSRQALLHQVAFVGTFKKSNPRHTGRKLPAGRGQNARFTNLTTQLVPQTARMCKGRDPERANKSATLRQPNVKQITRAPFNGHSSIRQT